MSLSSVKGVWWKPADREEKIWLVLAFLWILVLNFMMPYWIYAGKQNPSNETWKIRPEQYRQLADNFIEKYKVGEEKGTPIVEPPPGSDVFLVAQQWMWRPILKLKEGETYRIHVSSLDVQHGFSLYPININYQIYPGYDYVLTMTPIGAGVYNLFCNEFCGIGHHTMLGKIIVTE